MNSSQNCGNFTGGHTRPRVVVMIGNTDRNIPEKKRRSILGKEKLKSFNEV